MQTREEIKLRMLRFAAREWGYDETQMESEAFDPLVSLLMEACATELERIDREMHLAEERILDRIVALLTPDELTCAQTAHAVLHARSITPFFELKTSNLFYTPKKSGRQSKDIFFSPVSNYRVHDCSVAVLGTGRQVLKVDEIPKRRTILDSKSGESLGHNILWIGIELAASLSSIDEISFFFNWRNQAKRDDCLRMLEDTIWTLEGNKLPVHRGIAKINHEDQNVPPIVVFRNEFSTTRRFEEQIESHYLAHFMTVGNLSHEYLGTDSLDDLKRYYPAEFETVFSPEKLTSLKTTKYLWLKIEFPGFVPEDFLTRVECHTNCFPVMNRRYISESFNNIKANANILPLNFEDYFFDIEEVVSQNGKPFHSVPLTNIGNYNAGEFTLRKRGVNKFSKSDATRSLLDMIDVLRDESASFSAYDLEYLSDKVKGIYQEVNELEQQLLSKKKDLNSISYLIIKPLEGKDSVQISYWTTNGADANGIASGNSIDLYEFTALKRDSLYLMTGTEGGKDERSSFESRFAFKKALTNRERVVSVEDIKSFCYATLGEEIEEVIVRRGFRVAHLTTHGVERVVEVWLNPKKSVGEPGSNEEFMAGVSKLQDQLNINSASIIPIEVKIKTVV